MADDDPRPAHPDTVNPQFGESAKDFWERRKQARKDWNDWWDRQLKEDLQASLRRLRGGD